MPSFISSRRYRGAWAQPAGRRNARPSQTQTRHDRRIHPRTAVSFPIEFGVLPWFRHWVIRPTYQTVRSLDRNPTGSLAVPDPELWAHSYLAAARYLGKLLFVNGARCWDGEGRIESANGLDLSQGGLRMVTAYPLWLGASLHLRIPAHEVAPFGYTVLGKVVRMTRMDPHETEVGIAFTGIHPLDRHELARFLLIPLPQLAALRQQARQTPRPPTGEPAGIAEP